MKFNIDDYIHKFYEVEAYKTIYAPVIMPINGRSEWKRTQIVALLPPYHGRSERRPKKCRRVELDELPPKRRRNRTVSSNLVIEMRIKRMQDSLKCRSCGEKGHNKKGCPKKDDPNHVLLSQVTTVRNKRPPNLKVSRRPPQTDVPLTQESGILVDIDESRERDVVKGKTKVSYKTPKNPRLKPHLRTKKEQGSSSKNAPTVGNPPPTMYDQLKQSQKSINTQVKLRVPPTFGPGHIHPTMEHNTDKISSHTMKVVNQEGKKYVHLNQLLEVVERLGAKGK